MQFKMVRLFRYITIKTKYYLCFTCLKYLKSFDTQTCLPLSLVGTLDFHLSNGRIHFICLRYQHRQQISIGYQIKVAESLIFEVNTIVNKLNVPIEKEIIKKIKE